ncbi:MAG: hypothetical protein ACE5NC_04575 [Anaerolineae bacterium]
MGAIELVWLVMIVIFALAGVVRGYPKELGTTTSILVALLVLNQWGAEVFQGLDASLAGLTGVSLTEGDRVNLIQAGFYLALFIAMVFLSYHGETLAFRGDPPPGAAGVLINSANGAINGYLIAGTVWYYLDQFEYPIQLFGLFSPPLSDLATGLLPFLPVPLLEPYLLLFVAFLVLMRIFR